MFSFLLGCFFNRLIITFIGCLLSGMMSFFVVIVDVVLNSTIEFKTVIDGIKIDITVFQRFQFPKPLNPNIIHCPTHAIRRYPYFLWFKVFGPKCIGKLCLRIECFEVRGCNLRSLISQSPTSSNFFKNSFSTFNWPMAANNSYESLLIVFSNVTVRFPKNAAFHLKIITLFNSNFLDSSASIFWFLTASRAILALKAVLNFLRVYFFVIEF